MFTLLIFAFLAGIVTILSPCILPVLPIVLSGSVTGGHRRPLGIIVGFVASFTFFTLFAFAIVNALGLSPDFLRNAAIVILGLFGVSLIVPQISDILKKQFSKLANRSAGNQPPTANRSGFFGGLILGLSLGLVWTPCVGPIMSAVITLAATSSVSYQAALIALAYALGTAMPMFAVMFGGRALLNRVPWLLRNTEKLQKVFGVLMILIALAMVFGYDRKFQSYILDVFPNYGTNLTTLEDNETVKKNLAYINSPSPLMNQSTIDNHQSSILSAPNPNFTGATKWLNSEPLTLEKLKGKVVLVDFWTYTCINCIRTLPSLTSWHAKYADQGLVIIGVHSPEFAFEKEENNVRAAMKEKNIAYPVVQDNDFKIWRSYNNRYWPTKYLIDANGKIRYTHFGEGAYEETEKLIQELLKEAGMKNVDQDMTVGTQNFASLRNITPETYLGLARMEGLIAEQKASEDVQFFGGTGSDRLPELRRDGFILGGNWSFSREYARPGKDAMLAFKVKAKDVFLVMRPEKTGEKKRVRIGLGTGFSFPGKDVQGSDIVVDSDRLYHLIRMDETSPTFSEVTSVDGEFHFILHFPEEGLELYAFTFG